MTSAIQIGLERCLDEPPDGAARRAFGLLMNQASVDRSFRYACDLLAERFPGQLAAIFSPQHGLWGEEQANMIESPHGRYEPLDLPVYSLYSETRRPTRGDARRPRLPRDRSAGRRHAGLYVRLDGAAVLDRLRRRPASASSCSTGPIRSAAQSPKGRCLSRAIESFVGGAIDSAAAWPDAGRTGSANQRRAANRRGPGSRADGRLAARHDVSRHRPRLGLRRHPTCRG